MPCPNKVYQSVQLELAVILTQVVIVSRPSLASQNCATKPPRAHFGNQSKDARITQQVLHMQRQRGTKYKTGRTVHEGGVHWEVEMGIMTVQHRCRPDAAAAAAVVVH